MRTLRTPFSVLVTACVLGAALTPAAASDKDAKTANKSSSKAAEVSPVTRPALESFPLAKVPLPTDAEPPKELTASDIADGFYIEGPRHESYGRRGGYVPTYAMVFTSKEAADAHYNGPRVPTPESFCFNQGHGQRPGERPELSNSLQNVASVHAPHPDDLPNMQRVQLLRAERVVVDEKGAAVLQVRDAWVDPVSRGGKLIEKTDVPLKHLGALRDDVELYGFRTEETFELIAVRHKVREVHDFVESFMVMSQTGHGGSSQSSCHVRASLKTGEGISDTASIRFEVVLNADELPDSRFDQRDGPTDLKTRPMLLAMSSSWLSKDDAPLLSIARGWAGPERRQPF